MENAYLMEIVVKERMNDVERHAARGRLLAEARKGRKQPRLSWAAPILLVVSSIAAVAMTV